MSRTRSIRAGAGLAFALLPLGAVAGLPFGDHARVLIAWALLLGSTSAVWWGRDQGLVRSLVLWSVALLCLSMLPVGHVGGGWALAVSLAVVGATWREGPEVSHRGRTLTWSIAALLAGAMILASPEATLEGDGPAHLGGVLDALQADTWVPPDHAVHRGEDRPDPRFGVLHGLYAAMASWSGAPVDVVFASAVALWVPLGFLGFVAWMRAWSVPPPGAAVLALLMVLAGAGGRGFALWRAAFPGDAAVLLGSFVVAGLAMWLREERRGWLPVGAVVLAAASAAIHPFAWWIVVVCAGLAIGVCLVVPSQRQQALPLLRFAVATGLGGVLVLLPRLLGRSESSDGLHQVATNVIFLPGGRFVVDPLELVHWGGLGALLVGPLLLLAPPRWWRQRFAPLAAATALAAWLLALNPLLTATVWGAVAYLAIRTLRLVITPWWWWSLLTIVREDWASAGVLGRLRSTVLVAAVLGLAALDVMAAVTIVRSGPPRVPERVAQRIDAIDAAMDEIGVAGGIVTDPRTSYALRARRGGNWPIVPVAHSNPEDVDLANRLAAFRLLHAPAIDSTRWFDALETFESPWILVHAGHRDLAPYPDFGWIPSPRVSARLRTRLDRMGAVAVASGDGWSLHARPARRTWREFAAVVDTIPTWSASGRAALVRGSRFEVVAVEVDPPRAAGGETVEVRLQLRAATAREVTLHPEWEDVALRWRGPTAEVPAFARSFDKLYRKIVVERSARSDARFAVGRVPFEGTWPPDVWPEHREVVDRYEVRIPPFARPGLYEVELSIQEKPWRPRRHWTDIVRDDDRYRGPVVATFEVVAPRPPQSN